MGERTDAIRALQRAGEQAMRADLEAITADEVAAALDAAWGSYIADTGCIPDCFTIRGPRSTRFGVDFGYGNFAGIVADHINLHHMGASLGPGDVARLLVVESIPITTWMVTVWNGSEFTTGRLDPGDQIRITAAALEARRG